MQLLKFKKALCFGKERYYPDCEVSNVLLRVLNSRVFTRDQIDTLGEAFDLEIEELEQRALYKNGRKVGFRMKKLD